MGTAVLEMPKGLCAPSEVGLLGAFFQPDATRERNLVGSEERLIGELVSILDRQLIAAIDCRTDAEFVAVRHRVLPRYMRALRALNDTASNLVSDQIVDELSAKIIDRLSDDLRKQEFRFGERLTEQAEFTLWTMEKIRALSLELCNIGDAPAKKKSADAALLFEYRFSSLWAQFHLDCLFAAVKFDRPIRQEIREVLCDGLRASVNAFAIMKDALLLRLTKKDVASAHALPWDEEDEDLLRSSMRDINGQSTAAD